MSEPVENLIMVEDMLVNGADAVNVSCWRCDRVHRASIAMFPLETTLTKVQALMRCDACGSERVLVELSWS